MKNLSRLVIAILTAFSMTAVVGVLLFRRGRWKRSRV